MIIGYARTSTVEQVAGFEAQLQSLKEAGCDKLFQEQVSSVGKRAQLEAAVEFVREGDVLVVIEQLERKKVGLRILNLGMDTHTSTGKLMLTLLGGVAQFEREMMLERQREGIAKGKAAGRYKGRQPIAQQRQAEVLRLAALKLTKASIAKELNLGEATVYRILAREKAKDQSQSQNEDWIR